MAYIFITQNDHFDNQKWTDLKEKFMYYYSFSYPILDADSEKVEKFTGQK